MLNNFEIEKRVTDAFLKSRGITQYYLIRPEKDPPDVIVQIASSQVGIEVTSLISSHSQIKLEKAFRKIFDRVEERLIKSGISNLVIRIEPEKNVQIVRDKCVEVIVNLCLEKLDRIGLNKRTELANNPVSGIKKVTAFKQVEERIIITFDSRSITYGPLRDEKIGSVIENKIEKLNKSRQNAPEKYSKIHEYWLLITIEGTFYANYSAVQNTSISINKENCYDKIFVYHEKENWIVELITMYNTR
ncbi:hypothetical protein [Adhaeribacter rhizoryzae]|uniref:Uncharacterized protein n=1 Tax=Adhaeribacter rhizoryzae TaxID=2607907 RepID=A0A5M6DSX1_9BACT|nr:hypothetical protein [Adhaeribacter rhizoryzae]KAA5549240.1 hypothetical protein F0145_01200 [Adhaeribacter rhizoryzae]